MPSLMRLYAADRRPSGVRKAFERAVPMSVPPCVWLDWYHAWQENSHQCEPAADIIEADADDVVTLEGTTTWMIRGAVAKEVAVAETEIFDQVRVGALGGAGICEGFVIRDVVAGVSANEAFVSLTDNVCLATSGRRLKRSGKMGDDLPEDADLDNGADDGVHAGAVAARRDDCDLHGGQMQGGDSGGFSTWLSEGE